MGLQDPGACSPASLHAQDRNRCYRRPAGEHHYRIRLQAVACQ